MTKSCSIHGYNECLKIEKSVRYIKNNHNGMKRDYIHQVVNKKIECELHILTSIQKYF